jgi:hypothetical protein
MASKCEGKFYAMKNTTAKESKSRNSIEMPLVLDSLLINWQRMCAASLPYSVFFGLNASGSIQSREKKEGCK